MKCRNLLFENKTDICDLFVVSQLVKVKEYSASRQKENSIRKTRLFKYIENFITKQ